MVWKVFPELVHFPCKNKNYPKYKSQFTSTRWTQISENPAANSPVPCPVRCFRVIHRLSDQVLAPASVKNILPIAEAFEVASSSLSHDMGGGEQGISRWTSSEVYLDQRREFHLDYIQDWTQNFMCTLFPISNYWNGWEMMNNLL